MKIGTFCAFLPDDIRWTAPVSNHPIYPYPYIYLAMFVIGRMRDRSYPNQLFIGNNRNNHNNIGANWQSWHDKSTQDRRVEFWSHLIRIVNWKRYSFPLLEALLVYL